MKSASDRLEREAARALDAAPDLGRSTRGAAARLGALVDRVRHHAASAEAEALDEASAAVQASTRRAGKAARRIGARAGDVVDEGRNALAEAADAGNDLAHDVALRARAGALVAAAGALRYARGNPVRVVLAAGLAGFALATALRWSRR
jgi:hypothetical protein